MSTRRQGIFWLLTVPAPCSLCERLSSGSLQRYSRRAPEYPNSKLSGPTSYWSRFCYSCCFPYWISIVIKLLSKHLLKLLTKHIEDHCACVVGGSGPTEGQESRSGNARQGSERVSTPHEARSKLQGPLPGYNVSH